VRRREPRWGLCSRLPCRVQVRGLLVGQQAGDGLDGVAHVLAAAEVSGQGPPVLQVGNAVLDPDTARGVCLALSLVHLLVPVGAFFLNLRCGGVTTRPPV
jgi:hypothetical protein